MILRQRTRFRVACNLYSDIDILAKICGKTLYGRVFSISRDRPRPPPGSPTHCCAAEEKLYDSGQNVRFEAKF